MHTPKMMVKIAALSLIIECAIASGSNVNDTKKSRAPGNLESVQAALNAGRRRILEAWGSQAVEPLWVPLQPQFWRDRAALRAGDDGYLSRCRFSGDRILFKEGK